MISSLVIFDRMLVLNSQQDVEMPIPKYFINERQKALKEREKNLGQILAKLGPQDKDGVSWLMNRGHCNSLYIS